MKYLFLLLSICSTTFCSSQTYYRNNNETTLNFVRRIAQTYNFDHPIIESNDWDSTYWAIIYFVSVSPKKESDVIGYLLLPESYNAYRKVLIDTFYNKGGKPHIQTVFFANADKDKDKELIIMTNWPLDHPPIVGTMYGTYVYDNPSPSITEYRLKLFKKISDKLDGFEGKRNGETVKADYKNPDDIRAALRKQGY